VVVLLVPAALVETSALSISQNKSVLVSDVPA
jgi:hypothetical protein